MKFKKKIKSASIDEASYHYFIKEKVTKKILQNIINNYDEDILNENMILNKIKRNT